MVFNPIELSEQTERAVIRGKERKYNVFRLENFYGQMATARAVGCNLRCTPCWINPSRDLPDSYGGFYSPEQVHEETKKASMGPYGVMSSGMRISGCEPTIGREHLLSLIRLAKNEGVFRFFLLETNGILLGNDRGYVKALAEFKDYISVRLSLKAGNPKGFERRTGAKTDFFELPFNALSYLREEGIPSRLSAMSADPAIMLPEERRDLLKRLISLGEDFSAFEEEKMDLFGVTRRRLKQAGVDLTAVGRELYAPLDVQELRSSAASLHLSPQRLLELSILQTMPSPCLTCKEKNPWHGHGVEDDLDSKLI